MNKWIKFGITLTVVLSIIALLLFAAFKAFIYAIVKDVNKNLNNIISDGIPNNSQKDIALKKKISFDRKSIEDLNIERSNEFDKLKSQLDQYDVEIANKEKNKNNEEGKKKRAEDRSNIRKKYGTQNNLFSSSVQFKGSAESLNKKMEKQNLQNDQDTFKKALSALDFALDWPILDSAANKIAIKVLKNQMNEILLDLDKMSKLNLNNDSDKKQMIELFYKINTRLVIIKFALEIEKSRDMKVSSNKELKTSMNDIYNDLVLQAMDYKMQMVDENGNLIQKKSSIISNNEGFLPTFSDNGLKPKNNTIEEKKCLFIASTFEEVHGLNAQFNK
jgi:hypothetical protein